MKKNKILICLIIGLSSLILAGCNGKNKLLILNWGEYINEEIVEEFERIYNVDVVINLVESNELFYSKVKSGTTVYDLVVPSDYMIEKMVEKDLLQKIDFSLLKNYDPVNNPFMPGVLGIQKEMFEGNEDYHIPYFWGTFGLMYNKKKAGLEEEITNYGWKAYFEDEYLPTDTKVGMYDVPRFAYAAALIYNNMSPNEQTNTSLDLAYKTLRKKDFNSWGTDTLKKRIASDNLDLAFVYTGDFLDMLYVKLETTSLEDISFDIYVPDDTIAFMDSLVIPKKARHVELAHKFIDFLLDPEIAYLNASVIGYCTPIKKAYDKIVNYNGNDEWLNSWAYATSKYYPLPDVNDPVQYKGVPLANLDQNFLNDIITMVNNVKA